MSLRHGSPLFRSIVRAFALPLVCALVISVATVAYLVNTLLIRQVQEKVATDLRSARQIYDARSDRLAALVQLGANLADVRGALAAGDGDRVLGTLQALRVQGGADLLTAVGADGRVLARARNPAARGDVVTHLAPVRAALVGESVAATEVLAGADLAREGADLAAQAVTPLISTPHARPRDDTRLDQGMALFAATPVTDGTGRVVGALYAADLLNRDYALVDEVRSTVFGDATFEGRAVGTATLFLDDVRISTNVPAAGGTRAIGTRVSAEVAERVLTQGRRWIDRAFVVNDWYLSAYEPLTDSRGQVVGILYVGTLERPYRALVWRSLLVVGGLHVVGVLAGLWMLLAALQRLLGRPLGVLSEGARTIGAGDLDHQIPVERDDEIGQLARDFNAMTAALRERDREIEGLTRGLEEKVRQRSSALEAKNRELRQARAEVLAMMEKQQATNRELEHSLARLKETQEELIRSGRLAALGAMAAGVAHEVNNPLATIRGNLEILEIRLGADSSCGPELARMREQTDRVQGIVQNLLTFAREEKAEREPVAAGELAARVLESLEPQAGAAGVALVRDLPGDLPPVSAAPDRLAQVFTNLALNAVQAMPGGGTLRVTGRAGEREVTIAFADTGPGISPADQQRVWNPFYTSRAAGTGLGLSISHAIVEELGGRIHLESEPGEGATFEVVLPQAG